MAQGPENFFPETRVFEALECVSAGLKAVASEKLSEGEADEVASDYREEYSEKMEFLLAGIRSDESSHGGPLLPLSDDLERRVLILALASALDPTCAGLMDLAAGEPCSGQSDVAVLESLETHSLAEKLAFRRLLSPSGNGVKRGLYQVSFSFGGRVQLLVTETGKGLFLPGPQAEMNGEDSKDSESQTTPSRTLSDLVLSPSVRREVVEVIQAAQGRDHAIKHWGFREEFGRGLAISALFDGEPGTGKTLSAEVLAGELNRPLQRVNVARVLDKFVGGTQKNLEAAFEEASRRGSVLLFDEADALFSKRLAVESSQDRHANLEINLLLELMERFDGVVILTTNLRYGIDKAFERRIGYKIHFPFPSTVERESLWKQLIPPKTPCDEGLNFALLGESYELSGGSIKNALLRAAYGCAAAGLSLSQEALNEAAERECVASGKLVESMKEDGGGRFTL